MAFDRSSHWQCFGMEATSLTSRVTMAGGGAANHKGGPARRKVKRAGRSRGQERRNDRGTEEQLSSIHAPRPSGEAVLTPSGGARTQEAAHGQRFHMVNNSCNFKLDLALYQYVVI